MSKCGKNISDTLSYGTCDTLFCFHHILTSFASGLLLSRRPVKLNLFARHMTNFTFSVTTPLKLTLTPKEIKVAQSKVAY